MTLTSGTNLGRYEIRSLIGVGGMGEVYLANDPKIGRDVAIKVLPADFAADKDRVARFEQEAQAAGALNHPNILAIYDVDTHDELLFVVSELLEGEELRDVLEQGQIPLRKTIDYARQIVSGLTAAHEKGIVHRDLKPENLFITKDDRVKILDFGLAKLRETDPGIHGSEDATRKALTDPGMVMGTAGYMSPEQVRGQMIDHRSDIFSFGVILYEMITGKRAFQEESLAETMSAIVKEDPPEMKESNPSISPALERIVHRCLEKKPDRRFHTAHDLGFALETLAAPTSSSGGNLTAAASAIGPEKERSPWLRRLPWALALLLLVGLAVVVTMYVLRPVPDERPVSFDVALPESASFLSPPAMSPDGRSIAFSVNLHGKRTIYVRELGSVTLRPLDGTEGAGPNLFWSPDSRSIAFFAKYKLKKVDAAGGPVQVIGDAATGQRDGFWGRDGVILFSLPGKGIHRISASGGEATLLLPLDESRQEVAQELPYLLPDGRHFLYRSVTKGKETEPELFAASIDGKDRKYLLKVSSNLAYVKPGYLLYARENSLIAHPFDASTLQFTGDPVPVLDNVQSVSRFGRSLFSVSENGTLIYRPATRSQRQLAWFDSDGTLISNVGLPGDYRDVVLSPDDKKAAVQRITEGNADIWMIDLERAVLTRFTFDAANEDDPAWSSDGKYLIFSSNRSGIRKIYRKLASGAGNEELLNDAAALTDHELDWSADGKNVLYTGSDAKTGGLWVLPLTSDAKPYRLLKSESIVRTGHFSPDGQFFAYVSNESGRAEVYIQTFPPGRGKWQVSVDGGAQPKWGRDGKELYYLDNDRKLVVVPVTINQNGTVDVGVAKALFQTGIPNLATSNGYAVTADGQRFLLNSPVEASDETPFTVIINWASTLKK